MDEPKYQCICGLGQAHFALAACWTPEAQAIVDAKIAIISQNIAASADLPVPSRPTFTQLMLAGDRSDELNATAHEMLRTIDLLR